MRRRSPTVRRCRLLQQRLDLGHLGGQLRARRAALDQLQGLAGEVHVLPRVAQVEQPAHRGEVGGRRRGLGQLVRGLAHVAGAAARVARGQLRHVAGRPRLVPDPGPLLEALLARHVGAGEVAAGQVPHRLAVRVGALPGRDVGPVVDHELRRVARGALARVQACPGLEALELAVEPEHQLGVLLHHQPPLEPVLADHRVLLELEIEVVLGAAAAHRGLGPRRPADRADRLPAPVPLVADVAVAVHGHEQGPAEGQRRGLAVGGEQPRVAEARGAPAAPAGLEVPHPQAQGLQAAHLHPHPHRAALGSQLGGERLEALQVASRARGARGRLLRLLPHERLERRAHRLLPGGLLHVERRPALPRRDRGQREPRERRQQNCSSHPVPLRVGKGGLFLGYGSASAPRVQQERGCIAGGIRLR